MEEMKECKTCGEEIKAKALKCPRCQTWQSKWRYDQSNIKHIFVAMLLAFGVIGFVFLNAFGNIFNPKDFKDSQALIKIENTIISFSEKPCGSRVTILGTIVNNSDITWKDFYFEAQFYNKENELIDTLSDKIYDLILLKNDKTTFKITGSADKDEALYDHHLVIIKTAREDGSLF